MSRNEQNEVAEKSEPDGYMISVRGQVPQDVIEKISSAHARALSEPPANRKNQGPVDSEPETLDPAEKLAG